MSSSRGAPARARRKVVRVSPTLGIVRQDTSSRCASDQLGCTSETPSTTNAPELPPRINPPLPSHTGLPPPPPHTGLPPLPPHIGLPPPVLSHDGYTSMPPPNDYLNDMFLPRVSRFTGVAPRAAGPDRV
ncbi:hypothetical protein DFH29DRAFT_1004470 [Suillus ampliporus]|nr:hypothetical protein DFH29DRAFT_1004470 [Suillus ampliporus]